MSSTSASFVAGLVAGIAVDVPLHPVDTLKTRLQAREGFVAAGGTRGLWNGLRPALVASAPSSALFFAVYGHVQHTLDHSIISTSSSSSSGSVGFLRDATAASMADISSNIVRVPCDLIKHRMMVQGVNSKAVSMVGTGSAIVKAEGLRGLFAGFGSTVARDMPFCLIQMPLFEALRRYMHNNLEQKPSMFVDFTAGGIAGAIAGAVTTPLDAAKTQIMLTASKAERRNLMQTMHLICKESGFRGLSAGFVPRTLYSGIGGALWLSAFEGVRCMLS